MTHLLDPHFQTNNSSGVPNAGALLNFYQTTTTTPIVVYQDSAKVTPWTQPVVADASGLFPPIYIDTDTYKAVLSTSASVVIQTIDPLYAPVGAGGTSVAKFGDGAVGAPSITFAADLDTGIWRVGANEIGISVGGLQLLDISTTRMAINLTTTAPAATSHGEALQIVGNAQTGVTIDVATSTAVGPNLTFRRSRGTQASKTAVADATQLGGFNFHGADGSSFSTNPGVSVYAVARETWTASSHATDFLINTTPSGSTNIANTFTFTSDGYLTFPVQAITTTAGGITPIGLRVGTGNYPYWSNIGTSNLTVMDTELFVSAVSAVSLSNSSTSAQAIFTAANDTLTVGSSTMYFFEAWVYLGTGATSHTTAFGLGGTATFTSIAYDSTLVSAAATTIATAASYLEVLSASATVLNAASTAVVTKIKLVGSFRVNAGGTIIPQITFSAGPTGTCQTNINSYFRAWPVGSDTIAAVGAWA